MDDEYLKPVMSDGEYNSGVYDGLFEIMMDKVQKKLPMEGAYDFR